MSGALLVGEASRSLGEFRRPWVRALHGSYLAAYRRRLVRATERLGRDTEVTILASREVLDGSHLDPSVALRRYDEEVYQNDSAALAVLGHRLVSAFWPARDAEPALVHRGVWLPDLLPVSKGIVLRLDVLEALGTVERTMDQVKPDRVVLLTGASVPERLAAAFAADRGIRVEVAGRFAPARIVARLGAWLRIREERRALRRLLSQRRSKPPDPLVGPHVLFPICRERHLFVAEPVAVSLRARGVESRVVASTRDNAELEPALARISRTGLPGSFLMDYVPRAEARRLVQGLRPTLFRLRGRLARDGGWRGRFRHGGVDLFPVVAPLVRESLRSGLPIARLLLEAAFRALEAGRPEAVIVASDRRPHERAVALAARVLGIPTALFWGGALLGRDGINRFDVADRVLVFGEHARDGLVARGGLAAERAAIVGDPRSNVARLTPRADLRRALLARFGLTDDRPLLVLVSKYVSLLFSADEKAALYRTVAQACRRLGGPNVIVKVHPNENLSLLRSQVAEWGWPDAILTQDADIHSLFAAADAAIMVTSMAGLEAMALGCPVVAVQTAGKDFEGGAMPPYVSERVVEHVEMGTPDAVEALARAITRVTTDAAPRAALVERARAFAAPYLLPADGRFAERLLDALGRTRETGASERRG